MSEPCSLARVVAHHRGGYVVATPSEERWAELSGRFRHAAHGAADRPVVGDLVHVRAVEDRLRIEALLDRRTAIRRNAAGSRTEEQVLAANVDVVFVAVATNLDRFASRVERYVVAAWDSGAEPVVVLTKADLSADVDAIAEEIRLVGLGVPILATSTRAGVGIAEVRGFLEGERTGVLLGPSGVGKSSLVNALLGSDERAVREIRLGDHRGRHTTTSRALLPVPGGGSIIDTPGLRELQLWDDAGVARAFADIDAIGDSCRFGDCAHDAEPGCAIRAALEDGTLDAERYRRYGRLQREAEAMVIRRDARARSELRKEWIKRSAVGREARARKRGG